MAWRPESAIGLARTLACLAACSPSCGRNESELEAARALVEHVAALSARAEPAVRARQLEALGALVLRSPELRAARDRCVVAHGGLLTAELEQEHVRARLDRAGNAPLSGSELPGLRERLLQASRDLAQARAALPACGDAMRALSLRAR